MTKSALVTGASEGIGHSIAKQLAKEGYQITGVARTESKLKALIDELGANHRYIQADLSTEDGHEKVIQELQKNHYDLVVNNAGAGTTGDFTEVPLDRQLAMLQLNVMALVKISYAYLKTARAGDALVNVSSTLAFMPMPGIGLYSATKSFVTAFTDSLWFEQKKKGVFVTGLHPGITDTNFQVASGGKKEDLPKGMAQSPDQVAEALINMLNRRNSPTTFTGAKNRIFAGLSRIMPRKSSINLMGKMMSRD